MHYQNFFHQSLTQIHAENRYRLLRVQDRGADFPFIHLQNRSSPITAWCGVDYLGLSQHPILKTTMKQMIDQYGVGSGGTRTIGGTHLLHDQLEQKLAAWHHQGAALLFSTGYVANEATLSTLSKIIPDLVFLSDAENHMSIIEGIRHSKGDRVIFKHNDLTDLEQHLQALKDRPKIIVFESVYSMSGDFAPIAEIVHLAKQYNAMTYLDEVHATGVYGKTGAGLSEHTGFAKDIDIIQGTLGKSLGLFGGYIAANREIVDAVRLMANGFIFTVSLPPAICGTAIAGIDYLHTSSVEREALFTVMQYLMQRLQEENLPMLPSPSQIIPILIGDSKRCQQLADRLLDEFNIYIQAVNYPTVRKGQERLRISPTAKHTKEMADQLIKALKVCL